MSDFRNRILIDASGTDVGTITDVIADPVDFEPTFLVVRVGRLGGEHLVPMEAIETRDGQLVSMVDRRRVKSAPRIHDHIDPAAADRAALYRHYGLAS